jgi:hypothetical protein
MRNALFGLFCLIAVNATASPLSLKLPRYEQWKNLSPEAQREVIEGVQEFLIQAEQEARKSGDESALNGLKTLKTLYDLWFESAEAKPRSRRSSHTSHEQQPYCINQGVVKPISECDTSLGYKMHDFDTNAVLSKLGPASQCPSGQMPCSPFFGFTSDGQMFCSSKNLTRDCAQQSKQPGTLSLVHVMMSCQTGSPGVAKVNCKALAEFFDQQMGVVEKLCQKAPKRYACGVLKDQMRKVLAEASEKKPASDKADLDKIPDKFHATHEAAQMNASTAPCPTAAPQPSPVEKPAAQPQARSKDSEIACTQRTLAKSPDQPTLEALMKALMGDKPDDFVCGDLTLPNRIKIGSDRSKGSLTIQAAPDSKPVALDVVEAQVLGAISEALLDPPFKVPAKDLLSRYLPKETLQEPGKIQLDPKSGKEKREFPSKGWVTADGTRIRYIPNVDFGQGKKHVILAAIQPADGGKEKIVGVPVSLPDDQEESDNDSKALPSQPE